MHLSTAALAGQGLKQMRRDGKEIDMNTIIGEGKTARVVAPGGITELVRGTDRILVATLAPMVRQYNVALDKAPIHRIDAAGIAALISLYGCARDAGHTFSVCNVAPRIDEILRLVGLEAILVCHEAVPMQAPPKARLEQSAA
jgi:ABC-type transporter Mla MlaB component